MVASIRHIYYIADTTSALLISVNTLGNQVGFESKDISMCSMHARGYMAPLIDRMDTDTIILVESIGDN